MIRVPPGEPVYVGLYRHDVVVVGGNAIQFQVARPPATRYHEMHPGIVDTEPVQREMIADLERQGVSLLILQELFNDEILDRVKAEQRAHLPPTDSTVLDRYIDANFEPVERFGSITVWLRRPAGSSGRRPAPE